MIAHIFLLLVTSCRASSISADAVYVDTFSSVGAGINIAAPITISSGGLILSGAGGYVQSLASVTASSFWGDGSHLSGIPNLASTQTFHGSASFLSSFTVQSQQRSIVFSTGSNVDNIRISGDGAISFYPELHNSSATTLPEASSTNTNLGPCIEGSTLTIVTGGGKVEAQLIAEIDNDHTSPEAGIAVLEDGRLPPELGPNSQKGMGGFVQSTIQAAGVHATTKIRWLFRPLSAGAHSYCVTVNARSGGTTSIKSRTANQFFVKELR